MAKQSKRARKYSTSIRKNNKCLIEPNSIYKTDKDKCFSSLNPYKVKIDGISVETFISSLDVERDTHNLLKEYLKVSNQSLTAFLIKRGYNTPNVDLNALIEDLSHLLVIQDEKEYQLLRVNDGGYVIDVLEIDGEVISKQDKPLDLSNECYKFINGKYVLDEDKLNELGAML